MLGHKLVQVLQKKFDVRATIRGDERTLSRYEFIEPAQIIPNLDVENIQQLETVVADWQPAVIINAVGIVKQLPAAADIIKTLTINAIFPHRLYEIARRNRARLINISTDCVFSGKKGKYTENDVSDALDVYGKSKFLGETIEADALTIRTSIIGRELDSPHSLVEWFLSNRGKKIEGFTKAIFSGFPTLILAEIIGGIIEHQPGLQGLYHVASEPISKYDLLCLLNSAYRTEAEIQPSETYAIDRSLDSTKYRTASGFKPDDWERMVGRMAADNHLYRKN